MLYLNDRLSDLDLDLALKELSPHRREQTLRLHGELQRRASAAVYLLLAQALREEYGLTEMPEWGYGEHGKPFLIGFPHISFNLSHCSEAAICVVSDVEVGVDVERVRPLREGVVNYSMNAAEIEEIYAAERPDLAFTRLWTMKEAVAKWAGKPVLHNIKNLLQGMRHRIDTVVSENGRYVYSVCK